MKGIWEQLEELDRPYIHTSAENLKLMNELFEEDYINREAKRKGMIGRKEVSKSRMKKWQHITKSV